MQQENCPICLDRLKYPHGMPDVCEHKFCFKCISDWMRQRTNCPLCNKTPGYLIKIEETGEETRKGVRKRTAVQFENQLLRDQLDDGDSDASPEAEEDITIANACCLACKRSDNEHLLLLCDGIVGRNADGSLIHCNVACHSYCLPERLDYIPEGDWFCPFCVINPENTQGFTAQPNPNISTAEAGPSRSQENRNASHSDQNSKSPQKSRDEDSDEKMETVESSSIASSKLAEVDSNGNGGSDVESESVKSNNSCAGNETTSEIGESTDDVSEHDPDGESDQESTTESSNGQFIDDSESDSIDGSDGDISEDEDDIVDDDESDASDSVYQIIQPTFSNRRNRARLKSRHGSTRIAGRATRFQAKTVSKTGGYRRNAVAKRKKYAVKHRHHSST